jgi:hypothetical protein
MFVNDVRDITRITRDDLIAETVSWDRPEAAVATRFDEPPLLVNGTLAACQ